MSEFKTFVIISEPRTGSNMLVSMLSSLDKIICHAELFHPDSIFSKLPQELVPSIEERNNDPSQFINKILKSTYINFDHPTLIGFKLFFDHDQKVHKYVLEHDCAILLLERRNKLLQYSSIKIAKKTGFWTSVEQKQKQNVDSIIRFYLLEYVVYALRSKIRYYMYRLKLNKLGAPYVKVFYEDLTASDGLKSIGSFLGIDTKVKEDIVYKKQNPSNVFTRFSNEKYLRFCYKTFPFLFQKLTNGEEAEAGACVDKC